VSKEEETAIIGCVDAMETSGWVTVDGRRVQRMGGHPEAPPARMIPEAMPDWAQRLCDSLVTAGVFPADAPPNHVLVNEYEPGCGIPVHKDGPMYASRVAILSLGSVASFDFVQNNLGSVEGSVEIRRPIESAVEPLLETSSARAGFESGGCTDSSVDGSEDEHGFNDDFDAEFDLHEFWAKEAASKEAIHAADEDEDPEPAPAVEACSVVHVLHTCHVAVSLLLPPRGLLVFGDAAYEDYLHTVPALLSDEGRPDLVRLDLDEPWRSGSPSSVLDAETTASESSSLPPPAPLPPPPRSRRISLTVRRVRLVADAHEYS